MGLTKPTRRNTPLGVPFMAIGLVIAAFLGAGIGLVWQSSGIGADEEELLTAEEPGEEAGEEAGD